MAQKHPSEITCRDLKWFRGQSPGPGFGTPCLESDPSSSPHKFVALGNSPLFVTLCLSFPICRIREVTASSFRVAVGMTRDGTGAGNSSQASAEPSAPSGPRARPRLVDIAQWVSGASELSGLGTDGMTITFSSEQTMVYIWEGPRREQSLSITHAAAPMLPSVACPQLSPEPGVELGAVQRAVSLAAPPHGPAPLKSLASRSPCLPLSATIWLQAP